MKKVKCPFCNTKINLDDPDVEVYIEEESDGETAYVTCSSCNNEFEKHFKNEE